MKPGEHYSGYDHKIFEVQELYIHEQDPWVRYTNTQTGQEYTCRQQAFLQRFSLQPS